MSQLNDELPVDDDLVELEAERDQLTDKIRREVGEEGAENGARRNIDLRQLASDAGRLRWLHRQISQRIRARGGCGQQKKGS